MIDLEDVIAAHGPGDPAQYIAIADHFLQLEDTAAAAAALDRAYGLAPGDLDLARHRAAILDGLALRERGLLWRYIPAGTFLMGSADGDPDERPVHARRVDAFWITDTPVPWTSIWSALGRPDEIEEEDADRDDDDRFALRVAEDLRFIYCKSETSDGEGRYDLKPAVGISAQYAEALCAKLSTAAVRYALPSEAQWEKAARGGLVGMRYAWGDAAPAPARCDFDRMDDFQLLDPRTLPPNDYGLHGMCGGVAEWTADVYDALAYRRAAAGDLAPPAVPADEARRVLRGGSWLDCADAVTVSYRAARGAAEYPTPTIGIRLIRVTTAGGTTDR